MYINFTLKYISNKVNTVVKRWKLWGLINWTGQNQTYNYWNETTKTNEKCTQNNNVKEGYFKELE